MPTVGQSLYLFRGIKPGMQFYQSFDLADVTAVNGDGTLEVELHSNPSDTVSNVPYIATYDTALPPPALVFASIQSPAPPVVVAPPPPRHR